MSNHNNLCRDGIFGFLDIKNKRVIDRDLNLKVRNAEVLNLNVKKNATINGMLDGGNATLQTLTVAGNTDINSGLHVLGDYYVGNDLKVVGNANLCTNLPPFESLCINGNAKILGNLNTNFSNVTLLGNCIIGPNGVNEVCVTEEDGIVNCGNTIVQGNLIVTGKITAGGIDTTLNPPVYIFGNSYVVDDNDSTLIIDGPDGEFTQIGNDLNGASGQNFGGVIALSDDGTVMAVGAARFGGYARIYDWNGSSWVQKGATIPETNPFGGLPGRFGDVSLSSDGNTVATGFTSWYSSGYPRIGYVKIFDWNGSAWIQRGPIINGLYNEAMFGYSVSLASDGNTIAIGAWDKTYSDQIGYTQVFEWISPNWVQKGADINGFILYDHSGRAVDLSSDGDTLVIGEPSISSDEPGRVRIFDWVSPNWVQRGGNLVGENNDSRFGSSVSLTGDKNTVAIGAWVASKVYIYDWNSGSGMWEQRGPAICGKLQERFGYENSMKITNDGQRVAIATDDEDGVIFFEWNGTNWKRRSFEIIGTPGDGGGTNSVKYAIAFSLDGSILAVGCPGNDDSGSQSGRAYVWSLKDPILITLPDPLANTGKVLNINANTNNEIFNTNNNVIRFFDDLTPQTCILDLEQKWVMLQSDGMNWLVVLEDIIGQNVAPVVEAGNGGIIRVGDNFNLNGSAQDDGNPVPPGTLSYMWTKQSGPGTATFSNASSSTSMVSFDAEGTYVLQLTANDGELEGSDTVTITVNPAFPVVPFGMGADRDQYGSSTDMSDNGNTIAVAAPSQSSLPGFIVVYDRIGSNWVQRGPVLINPTPTTVNTAVKISGNNSILAGDSLARIFRVFDWNGSNWVQRGGSISNASGAFGDDFDFAKNNSNTFVTRSNSSFPYVTRAYQWNGSSWVQRGADLPQALSMAMSANGNIICIEAPTASSSAHVYTWTGASWVHSRTVPNPIVSTGNTSTVSMTDDASTIVIHRTTPGFPNVYVYDWTGSSYVLRAQINGFVSGVSNPEWQTSISNDGNRIFMGNRLGITKLARYYIWTGSTWSLTASYTDGAGEPKISGNGNRYMRTSNFNNPPQGAVYVHDT